MHSDRVLVCKMVLVKHIISLFLMSTMHSDRILLGKMVLVRHIIRLFITVLAPP